MKIFQTALFSLVATSSSAFTIAPQKGVIVRSSFVTRQTLQVALSPEDTSEEVAEEIKADIGAADGIFEDASELASEEDDALSPTTLDEEVEYKVYVGSLPFTVTADEVRKIFEDNSSVAIKSVSLPVNNDRVDEATGMPMSKGFAFVSVESEEDIEKAISAMNGFEIDGRTLRVNKLLSKDQMENMKSKRNMVPDGKKKLYVGNLPFDASYEDLKDYFGEYGVVHDLFIPMQDGSARGFAFVTMDEDAADMAIRELNGKEFMGRPCYVSEPLNKGEKGTYKAKQQRQFKIYVGNMSFQTSRETLQVVFQEFGDVYDCYIPTDPESGRPRGFAFVTMDKAGGEDAIQELDGLELDGRFIRVNEAQGSRKSKPQRTNDGDDDWYNDSGDNQPNSGFY